MKKIFSVGLILYLLFIFLIKIGEAQAQKKIAILPFCLYGPVEFNYLKEGIYNMFFVRLGNNKIKVIGKEEIQKAMATLKINEMPTKAQVYQLGKRLKADYVLYGNITITDQETSIAIKLLNMAQNKVYSFSSQCAKRQLLLRLTALVTKINDNIWGQQTQATIAQPLLSSETKTSSKPLPEVKLTNKWYSYPFFFQAKGLTIGDINGDGDNELVLIDDNNIWIYHYVKGFLALLKKKEFPDNVFLVNIDSCDLDQSGKKALLITKMTKNLVTSEVYLWQDGKLKPLAKDIPWCLKVQTYPNGEKVILGQKDFYKGNLFRLIWNGEGFNIDGKIHSLANVRVFDCLLVESGDNLQNLLCLDKQHHLIFNKRWKSHEYYDGLLAFDLDKKPPWKVMAYQNHSQKEQGGFCQGQFKLLSWDKMGMRVVWSSPKITGCITDCCIGDFDNDGHKELVFVIVRPILPLGRQGPISKETIVIAYDLSFPNTKLAKDVF